MFKNVFLLVTLIIFTIISLFLINIALAVGNSLMFDLKNYKLIYLFLFGAVVLTAYLMYMLIKGIRENELSMNYGYAYGAFLLIGAVLYFAVYANIPDYGTIDEAKLETNLQNVEVSDDENGVLQITGLYEKVIPITVAASSSFLEVSSLHSCLTLKEDCEYIVEKEKSLERYETFLKENTEKIETIQSEIKRINSYEYFKLDFEKDEYPNYQGLSSFGRLMLFQAMLQIENGEQEKSIELLNDYIKLGEKLITGDAGIIGMMTGLAMQNIGFHNFEYLINNYEIERSSEAFQGFEEMLRARYDSQEIYENMIKSEYQWQMSSIKNDNMRDSMFYQVDEFRYIASHQYSRAIYGEELLYENYVPSFFSREYNYFLLTNMNIPNYSGYIENIEEINILKTSIEEWLRTQ